MDFYRRISREAPEHLNEGGFLLFEIGWLQKDAVSALMRTFIGEPLWPCAITAGIGASSARS